MMTLEHLKLLGMRGQAMERSTGGTPDITFHEVCDMMARLPSMANDFARYSFAGDDSRRRPLESAIVWKLVAHRRDTFPMREVIDVVQRVVADYIFTNVKHEKVSKKHKSVYDAAWQLIDDCDYELRCAIRDWNQDLSDTR
jgi:hypothetical protein